MPPNLVNFGAEQTKRIKQCNAVDKNKADRPQYQCYGVHLSVEALRRQLADISRKCVPQAEKEREFICQENSNTVIICYNNCNGWPPIYNMQTALGKNV